MTHSIRIVCYGRLYGESSMTKELVAIIFLIVLWGPICAFIGALWGRLTLYDDLVNGDLQIKGYKLIPEKDD
jgi:hypothetical protein